MKTYRHTRKSAGAVLGLIAGVIFVIFIIGVFMFFAGRLLSGNHELNQASDAGILAVARQALVQPAIALNDPNLAYGPKNLPYDDFNFLADQKLNGYPAIDIATYNRCVAQSLIVGIQADKINTEDARTHAQLVSIAALYVGKALLDKFPSGPLDQVFDDNARSNSLNMLGNKSQVARIGSIKPAFIGQGQPSNIYFYPNVINPFVDENKALALVPQNKEPGIVKPDQAKARAGDHYFKAGDTVYYAKGYTPITIMPGSAHASLLGFIPVGPQRTPHGVDRDRADAGELDSRLFNMTQAQTDAVNMGIGPAGLKVPNQLFWLPPNAFKVQSRAQAGISAEKVAPNSDTYVNAVSCATIGVGGQDNPADTRDYPAAIPGGFIRVTNLPDMVQAGHLPLGPVPAPGEGNSYDASNFIANKEALGVGGAGELNIYVATPLHYEADGKTVNGNKVVFGFTPASKATLLSWINFNNSRIVDPQDPNYDKDVVTVNGVDQHRDPAQDPFKSPNNTAKRLKAGLNPAIKQLRMGAAVGQLARLAQVIDATGYFVVDSLKFDGSTPIKDSNGNTIGAEIVGQAMFDVAGANLDDAPPLKFDLSVPFDHRTWTQVEYLKYKIIHNFGAHFHAGHFEIPRLSDDQLRTGMKNFTWYHKNGKRVHCSSPNNFLSQTTGGTKGLEIPSSSQFMTVGTPNEYTHLIDDVIKQKGYGKGQITLDNFEGSIINQLRLINPKWDLEEMRLALASFPLAPGETAYLRDDGNGKLIMSRTCPQDKGNPPEGYPLSDTVDRAVWFNTNNKQGLSLAGYVLNTSLDGSKTAFKADCNVEQQPWRTSFGDLKLMVGAVLYKATGYNNLVGQINYFSQPQSPFGGMRFAHPN